MRSHINPPVNWQDFEELCLRLWRDIWSDPNAKKNGRVGQPQSGVDIYGVSSYVGGYHGVQCKKKSVYNNSELTRDEVRDEAIKADCFEPKLSSFIVATTSPRDEDIQKYCRQLTESKVHGFTVDVWSWDDIEDELQYRPDILDRCQLRYDDTENEDPVIKTTRFTSKDRLMAFMTRPVLKEDSSISMRLLLHNVIYELMQNAFIHGGAKQCMLAYSDSKFTLIDDGKPFDTTALLSEGGRGGHLTLAHLIKKCKEALTCHYCYKEKGGNGQNIFSMQFSREMLKTEINEVREFIINDAITKVEASRYADNQLSSLNEIESAYIIFGEITPLSSIIAYLDRSKKYVDSERVTVSLPQSKSDYQSRLMEYSFKVTIRQ